MGVILGVSGLSLLLHFLCKILLGHYVDLDKMPHDVVTDLGLHCLPMTLLQVSR